MAALKKPLHLLPLTILFLVLNMSPTAHSIRNTNTIPNIKNSSPFHFIQDLQGCKKGDSRKGLNKLKHYLHQYGYLKYQNQTHLHTNDFDDTLESALKTYQENFRITPTGTMDPSTVSNISTPRCGVPDINNGFNSMKKENHHHHPNPPSSKSFHMVAHYAFFNGMPRWQKTHLTYRFTSTTPANAMAPVASAFQKWAAITRFNFQKVGSNMNSDIVVGFYSGNHGDGSPFDGPGGTLAHAFPPTNGVFHFDADENWVNGAVLDGMDIETVALHEIGHLLGLGHSWVPGSIMFPGVKPGEVKGLQPDDIQGIRALYNL